MTTGEKITSLRKSKGLSQSELAEKIKTSRQSVSKWETGETLPDAENIVKLSELFEISADYLLKKDITETKEKNKEKKKYNTVTASVLTLFGIAVIGLINTFAHAHYSKINMTTYGKDIILYANNFGLKWLIYLSLFSVATGILLFIFDCYIFKSKKYKKLQNKPLKIFVVSAAFFNISVFIIAVFIFESSHIFGA